MRINAIIFLLSLLTIGCNETGQPAFSYIHSVVDTMTIDKTKNILIYTINPNDCISCINGFRLMNNNFSGTPNSCVYVISVDREIEKAELKKNIRDIDLNDSETKRVIWSKEVFDKINLASKKNIAMTLVTIYNYASDSIIYSKPIREVVNEEELKMELGK